MNYLSENKNTYSYQYNAGTQSVSYTAKFAENIENGKIFEMGKNKCRFELICLDIKRHGVCGISSQATGALKLKDIAENIDIEYGVAGDRIKENIIVRAPSKSYRFAFEFNMENLIIDISPDGKTLIFKEKSSCLDAFYLPAPFMFDANGIMSESVYYEVEQASRDKLLLTLVADARWINSHKRVFPVTIDPTVVSA